MTARRPRILFLTYHFPPFMASGAVRTGQTAKYLRLLGHDVHVVSADHQPLRGGLPLEIPRENVVFTPWIGARIASSKEGWARSGTTADVPASEPHVPPGGSAVAVWHALRWLQRHAAYVPDRQIGWYPFALRAALRVMRDEPIDLIYASAWPVTGLLVAADAARRRHVPWVAELRDLWSGQHYRELHGWQRNIDLRLEQRVLNSAVALVTVSQPLADALTRRFRQPVRVILNGFDERDTSPPALGDPSKPLRVAHLGWLYGGKRDPTPFFQALRSLRAQGRPIRAEFYGEDAALAQQLVRANGVDDMVAVLGSVPHAESLARQTAADVLLLLMYNAPGEEGVLTGKLFEYMGAGRPILAVGAPEGALSALIRERCLGFASSEPAAIATRLAEWIDEKRRTGRIQTYPPSAVADFRRSVQVEKLSEFLCSLAPQR